MIEKTNLASNVDAMDTKPRTPELKVEMPPCSEEINYADGNIYGKHYAIL